MSNWEKYKKSEPQVKKHHVPTKEQIQQAEQYKMNQLLAKQKKQEKKQKKVGKIDSMPLFNFQQDVKPDRFQPVIISHVSCQIQKENTKIRQEHVCYIQLYDTKSNKILYESFINHPSKYEIASLPTQFFHINSEQIQTAPQIQDVIQAVGKHFNDQEYYCGFQSKRIIQLLKQEILSSHIMELQSCASFQGDNGCSSLYQLMVNSGYGFKSKVKLEEIGIIQNKIYQIVRFKFDFEVAEFYKMQQK